MIEIKSIYGNVLYVAKNASDVRSTVIEAVAAHADLRYANLGHADLRYANLGYADLGHADLGHADLRYAKNAELAIAMTRILPEGRIIGWKKCAEKRIVKLEIPTKARRSHAGGRKCRSDMAKVLAIFNADGSSATGAFSNHDPSFRYEVGMKVVPKNGFDEDSWNECGAGIHWFITRAEAEAY